VIQEEDHTNEVPQVEEAKEPRASENYEPVVVAPDFDPGMLDDDDEDIDAAIRQNHHRLNTAGSLLSESRFANNPDKSTE
jgi:hypothetical protein